MVYFISFLVVFGSLVLGVSIGGDPGNLLLLWNVPSVIIVLVPAYAFSIAVTSWKTTGLCCKLVFSSGANSSKEEMLDVRAFLNIFGNISLLLGIVGTLIGLVLMLADLSDPNAIGPNMSVACITILYGSLLKFLCYGMERRVNQQLLTSEEGG